VKEKLNAARGRAAARREQDRAAREAAAAPAATHRRPAPAVTPRDERPAALATAPPVLLSRADLRAFYGITWSRAHLYRLVASGEFPRPVALGSHASSRKAWRRDDVEAFVAALRPADWSSNNNAS
jgi:predicted DNA-binding transcriptional regulator AlpA